MPDNRFLFAMIARQVPTIWSVVSQTGRITPTLNPQPLPPVLPDVVEHRAGGGDLNPQPLPPVAPEALGAAVGLEIARLTWTSEQLGTDLADSDDWCPAYPHPPKMPWWLAVDGPRADPWAYAGYYLGLAASLAVTLGGGAGDTSTLSAKASRGLTEILDQSVAAIESVRAHLEDEPAAR